MIKEFLKNWLGITQLEEKVFPEVHLWGGNLQDSPVWSEQPAYKESEIITPTETAKVIKGYDKP